MANEHEQLYQHLKGEYVSIENRHGGTVTSGLLKELKEEGIHLLPVIVTKGFPAFNISGNGFARFEWEKEKEGAVPYDNIGVVNRTTQKHLEYVVKQNQQLYEEWLKENKDRKPGF